MSATERLAAAIVAFMVGSTVFQTLTTPKFAARRRAFAEAILVRWDAARFGRWVKRENGGPILAVGAAVMAAVVMAIQAVMSN